MLDKRSVYIFIAFLTYEYLVISTFWVGGENVRNVEGIALISGNILQVDCKDVRIRSGARSEKFNILLDNNEILLDFWPSGMIETCDKFYSKFEDVFAKKKLDAEAVTDLTSVTRSGEHVYSQIRFEGYFRGSAALQVSFDNYEWGTFEELKKYEQEVMLFLCLMPFLFMIVTWLEKVHRENPRGGRSKS